MATKRVFRKLSNVEHVRQRTGMWLGQNSPSVFQQHFFKASKNSKGKTSYSISFDEIEDIPAKLKCLDEACMNAVDEYNRNAIDKSLKRKEKMSELRVTLENDLETVTVADNGRGIPERNAPHVFLHLLYGENFEDEARKEHIAGQNGVGISLVRIVSKFFFVRTTHNGLQYEKLFSCSDNFLTILKKSELSAADQKKIIQHYDENGEVTSSAEWKKIAKPMQKILLAEMKKSKMVAKSTHAEKGQHGTSVTFCLNKQYFFNQPVTFSIPLMKQYLFDIAMTNPGLKVIFSHHKKEEVFFFEKGLQDVFSHFSADHFRLEYQKGNFKMESFIFADEGKTLTWVNSIFASLGGSSVEYFDARFCDEVRKKPSIAALEKKLKTTSLRNDVRRCFHVYHNFHHRSPRFRSQDKSYFINDLKQEIREAIDKNLDKIIKKLNLLDKVKEQLERRVKTRDLELTTKEMRLKSRQIIPKFIAATSSKKKEERTLFIAEGDSAIAGIRPVRDPSLHALFPLRGKPLNVRGMSLTRALQNEEMKNIVSILSLPLDGKPVEKKDLSYDRICIITDADYDGYAIRSLVLSFFFEYWKELFSMGAMYLAQAPLYEVLLENSKKEKKIFYCNSDQDFEKLMKKGHVASCKLLRKKRNKGLGETSRQAMHHAITHCLKKVGLENLKKCQKTQQLWFAKDYAAERRKSIASYAKLFFDE